MPSQMIAYSYDRFSTPEQRFGSSKARQSEGTTLLCEARNWRLDNTLNISDLGRSAFKKNNQPGLAYFVKAIDEGLVEPGRSVLVIEKLDRLSRQNLDAALDLWRTILRKGVCIATHDGDFFDKASLNNSSLLMKAVWRFELAYDESKKKSDRSLFNWKKKRSSGKPTTGKAPAWLSLVDGKWVIDQAKADIVRQMFQWSVDGMGARQIHRELNRRKIQNIAYGYREDAKKTFNLRYVEKTLSNEAVIGVKQDYKMVENERVPEGEPIKGYFPAIVSEQMFYGAIAARKSRTKQRGPQGEMTSNLFQGIIYDESGNTYQIAGSSAADKKRGITRRLATFHKHDDDCHSWPYEQFENCFLRAVKEITAENVKPKKLDPLPGLAAKLAGVKQQIEKVQADIVAEGSYDALRGLLERLDKQRSQIEEDIVQAKTERQADRRTQSGKLIETVDLLAAAKPEELKDLRNRLKAQIRLLVSDIWVKIEKIDGNRLRQKLTCLINLADGSGYREFTIETWKGDVQKFDYFKNPQKPMQDHYGYQPIPTLPMTKRA